MNQKWVFAVGWLVIAMYLPATAGIPTCSKKRFPEALLGVEPVENTLSKHVCDPNGKESTSNQSLKKMADQQEFIRAFAKQGLKQTLLSAAIFKMKTEPQGCLQTEQQRRALLNDLKGKRNIYLDSLIYDEVYDEVFVKKVDCVSEYGTKAGSLSAYDCEDKKWSLVFGSITDEVISKDIATLAADLKTKHRELMGKQFIWDLKLKESFKNDPEHRKYDLELRYNINGFRAAEIKAKKEQYEKKKTLEFTKKNPSPDGEWQNYLARHESIKYPAVFSLMGTDAMKNWFSFPTSLRRDQVADNAFINYVVTDESKVFYQPKLANSAKKNILQQARGEALKHYQARAKKFQDQGMVGNEIWGATASKVDYRLRDLSELALSDPENFIRTIHALPPHFNYQLVCDSLNHAEKSIADKHARDKWINGINYTLMGIGFAAMFASGVGGPVGAAIVLATPIISVVDSASNAANMMYNEPEMHQAQIAIKMLQKKILDSGSPAQIAEYRQALAQGKFQSAVYGAFSLVPMINDYKILRGIIKSTPPIYQVREPPAKVSPP